MEDILGVILYVLLFLLYILLLPLVLIVATPFVLFWPGKRQIDGTRVPKRIGERYLRILKGWRSIGNYLT